MKFIQTYFQVIVEICATSVQSVKNAEKSGAHRIELCSELAVGGITPSYGLIKEVLKQTSLPVFVLIRPRSGDFTYSKDEFEAMRSDIQICKELGCKGIVSGILNVDYSLDRERTKELIEFSKPLEFTFHRAFDWVKKPEESIQTLIELGAHRILTSGQSESAEKGLNTLTQWKKLVENRLTILPGGGINPENVPKFKQAGFTEIHASASRLMKETIQPKISMNSLKFFDESKQFESDSEKIKKLVNN